VALAQAAATQATQLEAWWAGGRAPFLIVQPMADTIAPPVNARMPQEDIGPRVTAVEIPGAGHALLPEQPEAVATAEKYLDKVGLREKRDEFPARLSGGQKQRVAIARALTMEPKVLLFDEPTSALDPTLVGEVLKVMAELAHEGATMIVVTHEMAFAREAADQVYFIEEGVFVEAGPPDEVIERPKDPRTQQFLSRLLHKV